MLTALTLGLLFAMAALRYGAVLALDAGLCYAGIGALAVATRPRTRGLPRWAVAALFALPVYALIQTVPLPQGWIGVISPGRLRSLHGIEGAASLSLTPSATFLAALAMAAGGLTYLCARATVEKLAGLAWWTAAPLLAVGSLEAVLGLAQQVSGSAVTGTFVNRNHYAGLLELCLPFAVAGTVRFAGTPVAACGLAAAALAMLTALLCSVSRMGAVAACVSLCAMAMLLLPKWRWAPVGALLVVCAAGVILAPARFVERVGKETSASSRVPIWRETARLFADYPAVGCGFGAFESGLQPYRESTPMLRVDYAHNDYLQVAAEGGVIGAAVGAALLVLILGHARRAAGSSRLGIGALGAIAAILVHSLADFNLYIPSNMLLFAWVSGIAGGLARE